MSPLFLTKNTSTNHLQLCHKCAKQKKELLQIYLGIAGVLAWAKPDPFKSEVACRGEPSVERISQFFRGVRCWIFVDPRFLGTVAKVAKYATGWILCPLNNSFHEDGPNQRRHLMAAFPSHTFTSNDYPELAFFWRKFWGLVSFPNGWFSCRRRV